MDITWRLPDTPPASLVRRLANDISISETTAAILVRRGFRDASSAMAFLFPDESESDNPYRLRGMDVTADRVRRAIVDREQILIFGDYDADGIPGTALLAVWLRHAGGRVATYIPNRNHGYGLRLDLVPMLIDRFRPDLLITIDCGTPDHDAIRAVQQAGVDVVVLDHHLVLKGAPPTPYFVNPARPDETYPFRSLCGCGVAYKLVQALSTRRHERALYDLVATSTIGDQMALVGENRFYVRAAIEQMRRNASGNLGLMALAKTARVDLATITATEIGFQICPRINAVGRMGGDTNLMVECLTTSDHRRAFEIAQEADHANAERKRYADEVIASVERLVGQARDDIIVVVLDDVPIGVLGLIAARIVERYDRPALVSTRDGRGSGRAPNGVDLMAIMNRLMDAGVFGPRAARRLPDGDVVIPDFGGHRSACGFHNVNPDRLRSEARRLRVPRQATI
jgi:single-stranded-DNA-specific exonuclease